MGLLGKLYSALMGVFYQFFGKFVSAKLTISLLAVAAFVTLLTTLNLLFQTLLTSIQLAIPDEFHWGLGIIPNNIPVCISAILTLRAAMWVVQVKWAIVKVKMNF